MSSNMSAAPMWDDRYAQDGYLYGTEPAAFLTSHAHLLEAEMKTLVVADGEGRNSAYLAQQGLEVTAFDISQVGVDKAQALAADRGLTIDHRVADVLAWPWEPDAYDLVVGVFIQFVTPRQRSVVFDGIRRTLRPGGSVLLHGYRPEQVERGTGGPPQRDHMYTEALLLDSFAEFEVQVLKSYTADITEGTGHAGPSALIDYIAIKPGVSGR